MKISQKLCSSAAVVPVTGVALLSTTAGSWGRYLYGVSKRAFTKWALSLAGGAVVVGYITEKFAASEGVFLSSNTTDANEGQVSSGGEVQLSSASPDPKPLSHLLVSTDTHTEEGTETALTALTKGSATSLWKSVDDKAFEALLHKRNIEVDEYRHLKSAVAAQAVRYLHVPLLLWKKTSQGITRPRSNYFREHLQNKGMYLSKDQLKEHYENQYILDASYFLLTDVFKLIKNRTFRQFQELSLVEDGYALYTRPLLVSVATQMPRILKETCASKGLNHLEFSDCLEVYSHALLGAIDPTDNYSAVEPGKYLDSKYALKTLITGKIYDPVLMKNTLYSVLTSKVKELEKVYATDVKRLLSMVSTYHNDKMWDFFKISSEDHLSRVSRTRILEALVTKPSQYLNNWRHREESFFTQKIYADPLFYEKSNCLKDNQMAVFGC